MDSLIKENRRDERRDDQDQLFAMGFLIILYYLLLFYLKYNYLLFFCIYVTLLAAREGGCETSDFTFVANARFRLIPR